jgi:hypothetical protein
MISIQMGKLGYDEDGIARFETFHDAIIEAFLAY